MSVHGLLLFCFVYLLATASPGPGIAAIIARVMAHGSRGIAAFLAGFVVGDLIWFTLAATGMSVIAQQAHAVFVAVKFGGVAYLLFLAYKLWTSPAQPVRDSADAPVQSPARLFAGSLALTLGNPKVMVFFLALLPTVVDVSHVTFAGFMQIAAGMAVIISCVLSAYAIAALRARRFFRNAHSVRWLNRGSGTVMAGAAIVIATR
jgi:threonine/homoserine/homoserine lactone efflux protein